MSNALVELGDLIVDELNSIGFTLPITTIERRNTFELDAEQELPPGRRIVVAPAGYALVVDSRDGYRADFAFAISIAESVDQLTLDAREARTDELHRVLLEIAAHLADRNQRKLGGKYGFQSINRGQTVEPFDADLLRAGVYWGRHVYLYSRSQVA